MDRSELEILMRLHAEGMAAVMGARDAVKDVRDATLENAAADRAVVAAAHSARDATLEQTAAVKELTHALHEQRNAALEAGVASRAASGGAAAGGGFAPPGLMPVLIGVGVAAATMLMPWLAFLTAGAAAVTVLAALTVGGAAFAAVAILLANATGQINGPMAALQKTAKGAADTLGKELAPIARDFIGLLNQLIPIGTAALRPVIDGFRALMPVVLPFLKVISSELIIGVQRLGLAFDHFLGAALAGSGAANLEKLFQLMLDIGVGAINGLLTNLLRLSNWFFTMLPAMGPQVGTFFSGLGSFVQWVGGVIAGFAEWVVAHWPQISAVLTQSGRAIADGWRYVAPVIAFAVGTLQWMSPILQFIGQHANELKPVLMALGGVAAFMVASFLITVSVLVLVAAAFVGLFLIGDKVVNWLKSAVPAALHGVGAAFSAIGTTVHNVIGWFGGLFSAIGTTLHNIVTMAGNLWAEFARHPLYWIGFLLTFIPVKIAHLAVQLGVWLLDMIGKAKDWAGQMITHGVRAAQGFLQAVMTEIPKLPGQIWTWLVNVVTRLAEWGSQMVQKGIAAIKDFATAVVKEAQKLPGQMLQVGKDAAQGIIDGIKSLAKSGAGAIGDFVKGLVEGAHKAGEKGSPYRLFAREVGLPIAQGVALGILQGASVARGAMTGLVGGLAPGGRVGVGLTGSVSGPGGSSMLLGRGPSMGDTNDLLEEQNELLARILATLSERRPFSNQAYHPV